ncbi:hypothetical protein WKI68_25515 [Streptomyces sp. MS1.HAVA.3]|uniref:Uncharacterized protein n=1 Tax=Streptomyces caledonius TaxID=3134107 RepID=A0ABU8U7G6_9ACTN
MVRVTICVTARPIVVLYEPPRSTSELTRTTSVAFRCGSRAAMDS